MLEIREKSALAFCALTGLVACGGSPTSVPILQEVAGVGFTDDETSLPEDEIVEDETPEPAPQNDETEEESAYSIADDIPSFPTVFVAINDSLALTETVGESGLTPSANFRTHGSVTYQGVLTLEDQSAGFAQSATAIGGMAVKIDFANAANVEGEASNFFDADGQSVEGRLEMSNVIFDQGTDGGGFVADLDRTLEDMGGRTDYTYDLELVGLYFGPDQDAIIGLTSGTATGAGSERSIFGSVTLD